MENKADVVICGAGIAGVATAYHLVVHHDLRNVVLVDERPPLTLTSDKSTECYRNWWPSQAMTGLMNRSIDWLEQLADESDNYFHLNRRGYVYLTANPATAVSWQQSATAPLRIHEGQSPTYQPAPAHGYREQPTGADLLLGSELIRAHFPFVSETAVAALHVRRAGWLSAQQLGMYLWQQAREKGARLVNGRLTDIHVANGQIQGVTVSSDGRTAAINTGRFVNAAGPFLPEVSAMMGVDLSITNEQHGKIAIEDPLGIIPRDAPLMIWNDPVRLPWTEEEQEYLAEQEATRWLLEEFPAGAHFRPEGGPGSQTLLFLWPYHTVQQNPPRWPLHFEPEFADILLRGMARLAPGLAAYFERMSKPLIDGGYYTRTAENWPLIGPLPVDGAFVVGALSGYGLMAAPAAGELAAAQIMGAPLPDYASAFLPARLADPAYWQRVKAGNFEDGQL